MFIPLYLLHILNDGFHAGMLLLLPFIKTDLQLNLTQVGFLGTLVNSLGILLAFPAGYIATKLGGLKALILALLIYGLGFIGVGIAPNYLLLLPMFMLAGTGFGVFHPIGFALVARWSDKQTRGKQMGNFTALGDVGRIGIAASLTFLAAYIGWRLTAGLSAFIALSIAAFVYAFFLKPQNHLHANATNISNIKIWEIITHKKFLLVTLAGFFDAFASSSLYIFLPFLLLKRGVSHAFLGSFSAAFFIGNFFGKTTLGRLVDKLGNTKVFMASELFMAVFILLLAHSTNFVLIIICSVILGVFTKGTVPVIQTMVSEASEHHGNFEKAFAVSAFVSSIAGTLAPVFLGYISDSLGIITAFTTMALAALMAILPTLSFHLAKRTA